MHVIGAALARRCDAASLPVAVHVVDPGIVNTPLCVDALHLDVFSCCYSVYCHMNIKASLRLTQANVFPRRYRHVHWVLRPALVALAPIVFRTAEDAAAGVTWAAASEEIEGETGGYGTSFFFLNLKVRFIFSHTYCESDSETRQIHLT